MDNSYIDIHNNDIIMDTDVNLNIIKNTFSKIHNDFYDNPIYKDYINCKLTYCYPLTELYLNNLIIKTKLTNIKKENNEKYNVNDYINIKKKYNYYYISSMNSL